MQGPTGDRVPTREPAKAAQATGADLTAPVATTPAIAKLQDQYPETGTRVVYGGGGPRTSTQACQEIQFIDDHAKLFADLQDAGAKFDIQSVIVERGPMSRLGRGNAWDKEQGKGTVNTGAESLGVTYDLRLEGFISNNKEALYRSYEDHPVVYSNLESAEKGNDAPGDGRFNLGRGVLARADQGEEENQFLMRRLEHAKASYPFYKVTILPNTAAVPDFSKDPYKPDVALYAAMPGSEMETNIPLGTISADTIRQNTGTTVAKPKLQPGVEEHTFSQAMDPVALKAWCAKKGLLGKDGLLKPDTRLISGGLGLSAIDQFIALNAVMHLFDLVPGGSEKDPANWIMNPEALKKYPHAIADVSNSGTPIPPRLTGKSPEYTQKIDALGTTRQLHAAFLHESGEKIFTDVQDILWASAANTLEITPQEMEEAHLSTEKLLEKMYERTKIHEARLDEASKLTGNEQVAKLHESAQVLEGVLRQLYFQANIGTLGERDLGEAINRLEAAAPHTAKGRVGTYLNLNAQPSGVTQPRADGTMPVDNRKLIGVFNERMRYLTASPAKVWPIMPQMFGISVGPGGAATMGPAIVKNMLGSYNDIRQNEQGDGKPLQYTANDGTLQTFDAFIVSPGFTLGAEPFVQAQSGHIEPVHPDLPMIGKMDERGRIMAADGTRATTIEGMGLAGKGGKVDGTIYGEQRYDINNRESATAVAPGLAYQRFAPEFLKAVGHKNAYDTVSRFYDEALQVDPDAWKNEVDSFEPDFQAMQTTAAVARAARSMSRYPEFNKAVETTRGEPSPDQVRDKLAELVEAAEPERKNRFQRLENRFEEEIQKAEPFNPVTAEMFHAKYANVPMHIHQAVFKRATELAFELAPRKVGGPTFQGA